jgi:asparagine synthase (glutamine-hydrolysing)
VGWLQLDELIEYCSSQVTDEQMTAAISIQFANNQKAYFYRSIFHKHYPQLSAAQTVRKWIPKWQENPRSNGNKRCTRASRC